MGVIVGDRIKFIDRHTGSHAFDMLIEAIELHEKKVDFSFSIGDYFKHSVSGEETTTVPLLNEEVRVVIDSLNWLPSKRKPVARLILYTRDQKYDWEFPHVHRLRQSLAYSSPYRR